MLKVGTENKYEQPFSGPCRILQVFTNGTVHLQMGAIADSVNIRQIEPFKAAPSSIHGGNAICATPKDKEQQLNK